MARGGEGQGKTIAIVILFILMVVGFSSTWYFYNEWDKLNQTINQARQNEQTAKRDLDTASRNYSELVRIAGGASTGNPLSDHQTNVQRFTDILSKPQIGQQRLQQRPAYDNLLTGIEYLHQELQSADQARDSLDQQKNQLEQNLRSVENTYQQMVTQADAARKAKEAELAKVEADLEDKIVKLEQNIETVTKRYRDTATELEQNKRDLNAQINQLDQTNRNLVNNLEQFKELDLKRDQLKFEHSDGEIVQTNRGGREAYLNIGADDGVRTGMTFGVYSVGVDGNPYKLPKAAVEVVRVEGEHRSLGRISNTVTGEPILRGDQLYNPLWSPGDNESIAISGLIYMDDDSEPDNEQFKRLVRSLGSQIDAEVNLKNGEIQGQIGVNTGWLVIGEIPEVLDTSKDSDALQLHGWLVRGESDLRRQALNAGVRVINVRNFLTYMGKSVPQRTVREGQERRIFFGKPRPKLVDELPGSASAGN